jgi:chaperonin GroES
MATKTSLSIQPLGDRVVVKPLEAKEETVLDSGIIIPETDKKEKPSKGKVVAVGPGRFDDGVLVPMSVKNGQTVLFSKYGYDEVKMDGVEYFILSESQILAVIEN